MSERKKMLFFQPIPYTHYIPPRLTEGKEWYISYSVINPETKKMKRFRIKCNREHNLRERRKIAKTIIAGLSTRLAMGWSPFVETKAPKSYALLFNALDSFISIKEKETESNSMRSYRSFIKIFKNWLLKHNINEKNYCCAVTKDVTTCFMGDVEENVSPKTYNNYLNFFKGLFNWFEEKGYTVGNPFSEIHKKPKRLTKKTRRLLSDMELSVLIDYLKTENPEYLAICMLCYCCFMRPKEIALLKCGDIDLKKQVVHVAADIAKNDNTSYRTIPDNLLCVFKNLDLSKKDYFLFGQHPYYSFTPGNKRICSRKIAAYWGNNVRKACGFPMELQFYSLKDTGITNFLGDGVPISFVQQQADHSSVAVTAIYVGKKASANEELKKVNILPKI